MKIKMKRDKWAEIYRSFDDIDIFYLPEYAKLFELHGDGEPFLFIYYQSKKKNLSFILF